MNELRISKHYRLRAEPGNVEALRAALEALAAAVALLPGAIRVEIYRDTQQPDLLLLVELWASEAAYQASSIALGKDAFKPVMALLSAPPDVATLAVVSTHGAACP